MRSYTQFNLNCMSEWIKSRFEVIVTSYGRNKNLTVEIKNTQVLTYNSKKFHWLNKKLEWNMNGLGKPFRKKSDQNNWRNCKNQIKIAACEQKATCENFCSNAIFSLYLKMRAKYCTQQNHSFSLHFLFRVDQNHHAKLTPEIMKMCEQILKKTSPQYNSNPLNWKNIRRPIRASAIGALRLMTICLVLYFTLCGLSTMNKTIGQNWRWRIKKPVEHIVPPPLKWGRKKQFTKNSYFYPIYSTYKSPQKNQSVAMIFISQGD